MKKPETTDKKYYNLMDGRGGEFNGKQYAKDMILYRAETNQHERLKCMMLDLGINYHDIATLTGHSYNSIKSMLQPKKKVPRWINLVLYVWDNRNKETNK